MVQHSRFIFRGIALSAAVLLPCFAAQAQTPKPSQAQPMKAAAPVQQPDPLDPQASVPAFVYQSAFAQYRVLGSQELISWRQANDNVAAIGGWRVYLRQAQQPEPAQPAQMDPPQAQPKAERGGQGKHGSHGSHSGHSKP